MAPRSLLASPETDLDGLPPIIAFGFRPFFLLAAIAAVALAPAWMLMLGGKLTPPTGLLPVHWHAHEMIFGFAGAVLAGFLLTAARNWTRLPTAHGMPLALLASGWIAARTLVIFGGSLPVAAAALDAALLPIVGLVALRPIVRARSHRNLVFPPLMVMLGVADVVVHLAGRGIVTPALGSRALVVALDLVLLAIVIVGGRIIPGFSANALGAAAVPRRDRGQRDTVGLFAIGGVLVSDAVGVEGLPLAGILMFAAAAHGARMRGWGSLASRRDPLLAVLHAGWGMVAVGLALRATAVAELGVPTAAAIHVLTIGAVGLLTLGMMARVALGHTGRLLRAPRTAVVAFVLVGIAMLARVVPPLVEPDNETLLRVGIDGAATLWAIAFALFLVRYAGILAGPRVDGKPG